MLVPAGRVPRLALATFFVVAVVSAAWAIRPWLAAPVAFDAAAAVLHFERILSGHRMEDPYLVLTTPKPLLTLVYGLLYAAFHDWRAISFVVLVAWGFCVTLAGALTWRLGGAIAAIFVVVAFVCSAQLLIETALALGAIWALLLWLVAGLAVTEPTPRWGLAGGALALAALARLETFVVIGLALAVLTVLRFGPHAIRRPVAPRSWLVGVGLLALPVMLVHDWLLTGDPLFWTAVSVRYSESASSHGRLPDVATVAREIAHLVRIHGAAALLAVIGFGALAVRRRWAVLVGLVALGPGVAAFLLLLAFRHVYVDPRYLLPIEETILFSAGIGLSALSIPEFRGGWTAGLRMSVPASVRRPAFVAGGLAIGAVAAAVLLSPTIGPLDHATRTKIVGWRNLARTSDVAVPALREAIAGIPDIRALPGTSPIGTTGVPYAILAPAGIRPRLIVDLDLPIPRVMASDPSRLHVPGYPANGQIIVIDKGAASPAEAFAAFEVTEPTVLGGTRLTPLVADPSLGTWVVRIETP